MGNTKINTQATTQDETLPGTSFDELSKALARGGVSRRRTLSTLGLGLIASALGSLALVNEADAKKGHKRGKKKGRNRRNSSGNTGSRPPIVTAPPVVQPVPVAQCLAAGNQCGTNAAVQGRCRAATATDNQAGFICTSNTAGNLCTASTQCGAGTRCVVTLGIDAGVAGSTCRVLIS
jgi:hypothetical protein